MPIRRISKLIAITGCFLIVGTHGFGAFIALARPEQATFFETKNPLGQIQFLSVPTAYADDDDDREHDDDDDRERDDDDKRGETLRTTVPSSHSTNSNTNSTTTSNANSITSHKTNCITSASGVKSCTSIPATTFSNSSSIQTTVQTPTSIPNQTRTVTPALQQTTSAWNDGSWFGTDNYVFGTTSVPVTVRVTIRSGLIAALTFDAFPASPAAAASDFAPTFARIVADQQPRVDTVTGATGTSRAVQNALNMALAHAKSGAATVSTSIATTPATAPAHPANPAVETAPAAKSVVPTRQTSHQNAWAFDVPAGHFASEPIRQLLAHGVVGGYADGSFRPDAPVNRAEGIKMIVAMTRLPLPATASRVFADVPRESWYAPYVQAAVDAELINVGANFRPGDVLTRAEAVKILASALAAASILNGEFPKNTSFSDVDQLEWYAVYAEFAKTNGIINGYADGKFGGGDAVTRGQLAKMLIALDARSAAKNVATVPLLSSAEVLALKERRDAAAAALAAVEAAKRIAQTPAAQPRAAAKTVTPTRVAAPAASRPTTAVAPAPSNAAAQAAAAAAAQQAAARAAAAAAAARAAATPKTNTTTAAS